MWREWSHTAPTPRSAHAESLCPLSVQITTGDLDGFQADTEEEEEEDGDCVIMDISDVTGETGPRPSFPPAHWQGEGRTLFPLIHPLLYTMGVGLKDLKRQWVGWPNGGGQLVPVQALEDLT